MDTKSEREKSTGVMTLDKTVSPTRVNIVSVGLALIVIVAFFYPYVSIWGAESLAPVLGNLISPFLLVLALSIVVHEMLHGAGCVLAGRVSWREIKFGFKGLMVYAHCKVPVSASAYRVSLVLPGLLLGFVPGLVGLAWGSAWLTVFGALMVIAALGDFMLLWVIRSVPKEARVKDHPSEPGCQVLLD